MDIYLEKNIHKEIKFSDFCKVLEAIHEIKRTKRDGKHLKDKERILKGYVEAFKNFKGKFTEQNGSDSYTSFFPILRLLLPGQDKIRTYGLKDTALARLYINSLVLGETSSDAALLRSGTLGKIGTDFGDVVFQVMKDRCKDDGTCNIFEINEFLNKIADLNGQNRSKDVVNLFSSIIPKLSAIDHKWLARIIIKDLDLQFSTEKILETYHSAAGQFYKRFDSLKKICEIVESGQDITDEILAASSVELFIHVRPQLCDRMSQTQINDILGKKELLAETKMDGERLQIHRQGNKYRYFTRQGHDVSNYFGETPETGHFTRYLHNMFNVPVTDIILDGEMMVWHKHEKRYVVKGENVIVRSIKNHDVHQECFVVYDILYLNGVNMIQKHYAERVRLMSTLFDDVEGIMLKVKRTKVKTSAEILSVLNKAIDDHEEGVVLKVTDAFYSPGIRGGGWFKIKPDYLGNLITDLDLLIIAAEYKKGRDYYENFLLGVKDNSKTPPTYLAVCTVTNAMNFSESTALRDTLELHKKIVEKTKKGVRTVAINPPNLDFGSNVPDIYFEPENSIVLEIKATELQKSSSFCTAFTLRFPRIMKIRRDKDSSDCCTLSEFESLFIDGGDRNEGVRKLVKRHATETDLFKAHTRSLAKRRANTATTVVKVNSYTTEIPVVVLDDFAKGLKICILSSDRGFPSKNELENYVRMHGGTVVANPGKDTFLCVAKKEVLLVKRLCASKEQTIVTLNWFLKAFPTNEKRNELIPIRPCDIISAKPEFEADLRRKYDIHGDTYTEPISKDDLLKLIEQLNDKDYSPLMTDERFELETEIMGRNPIYNIFRGIKAFFDTSNFKSFSYALTMLAFVSRSGIAVENSTDINDCDYFVLDVNEIEKTKKFKEKWNQLADITLIDYRYFESLHKGEDVEERQYTVK